MNSTRAHSSTSKIAHTNLSRPITCPCSALPFSRKERVKVGHCLLRCMLPVPALRLCENVQNGIQAGVDLCGGVVVTLQQKSIIRHSLDALNQLFPVLRSRCERWC